jgi:hypothetical protein
MPLAEDDSDVFIHQHGGAWPHYHHLFRGYLSITSTVRQAHDRRRPVAASLITQIAFAKALRYLLKGIC